MRLIVLRFRAAQAAGTM